MSIVQEGEVRGNCTEVVFEELMGVNLLKARKNLKSWIQKTP